MLQTLCTVHCPNIVQWVIKDEGLNQILLQHQLQFTGKILLKKELFSVQLIMAFGLVNCRFQDITSALQFAPLKSASELQKVGKCIWQN